MYVLVVHDEHIDVNELCIALEAAFIVREATTAFDTLERLAGAPLACVVCVIGGAIIAEDFFQLVTRASPEQAARVVFVAPTRLSDREQAFLKESAAHLVPNPATPAEVLAIVNAVSATR